MINDQSATDEKKIKLINTAIIKTYINFMASKLEELGQVPHINPDSPPAKMEDEQYSFLFRNVILKDNAKKGTVDEIKSFCDDGKHIDRIFNLEQANILKQISPQIRYKDIREFLENELKRLEQSVPAGEVGIRLDSLLSQEDLAQKEKLVQQKKVDALIKFHDSGKKIELTQERFCMLIKEYISEAYNLMQKTLPDSSSKEEKDKYVEENSGKLIKIGDLIDRNKPSLNFLGTQNIEDNDELRMNVPGLMYLTCYKGDLKSLNTLIENLGERNLLAVFLSMQLKKEFDGTLTLNGMLSMVNKRAANTKRKDSAEWKKVLDLFERTVVKCEENNKGLSGLSLAGQDDGGPAARSTRVRDGEGGSAVNVASGRKKSGDGKDESGPAKR